MPGVSQKKKIQRVNKQRAVNERWRKHALINAAPRDLTVNKQHRETSHEPIASITAI